ncbi:MAG: lipoyl synthase [Candidatus Kapaibacteriota bacterium]|jgi:lipoic acid synthetase
MHKIDYPSEERRQQTLQRRPEWLKVRAPGGETFSNLRRMMRAKTLHTVCEEAHCPNIGECWGRGTATFLILGDTCTRSCGFCAIKTGRPNPVDPEEPLKVAIAVQQMGISHVVITSVNRDELPDQGSTIWAKTILEVRRLNPNVSIEVLIPDFKGDTDCLQRVLDAKPNILNHNVETVPHLYRLVRPQAKYERSLKVLQFAKEKGFVTKTGIMVGIGETFDEVVEVMKDLREIGVDIFTVGQYLQPTPKHLPVDRFVTPEEFKQYRLIGIQLGFRHVESGPLVRSSYHAESHVR